MSQSHVLAQTSRQFFVSASHLLNHELGSPLPALFLLARSIELALKSILVAANMSSSELAKRSFGHNLGTLLKEAYSRGTLDPALLLEHEISAIHLLDREYSSTHLGYPKAGAEYLLPRLDLIDEAAKKLLQAAVSAQAGSLHQNPKGTI